MERMLKLSSLNWLGELLQDSSLPKELTEFLGGLIEASLIGTGNSMNLEATPKLIALAKKHLSGGIQLGGRHYAVMVHMPAAEKKWPFFVLVPSWPGGILMRLGEF